MVIHVDGIVDGDAQNHRHNNHRNHVERHIQITHKPANQQHRGYVRYHADKPRTDTPESKNHHDGDNHERAAEGAEQSAHQLSIHFGVIDDIPHNRSFCLRENARHIALDTIQVFNDFIRIVARKFHVDICRLVIFIHPAKNGVRVGNFVEEQQLREHVFFGRNGVIGGIVTVQSSIHFFHEARDRLHARFPARNFSKLERSQLFFQFFNPLHVRRIFQGIGIVEFHHHIEIVKASQLSAEHIQEPHHIGNLLAHSLGVVHVDIDLCNARNLEQHDGTRNNRHNDTVPANLASEKFEEDIGLGGACRLDHIGFRFRIAPETHEDRNQHHHVKANHRDNPRRNTTNPTNRPNSRK